MIGLSGPDVHIWWLSLESRPELVERGLDLLSADERARAHAFHFSRDRLRFVLGRAFLRTILGRYTGTNPGSIPFRFSSTGKPSLADSSDLHFNLSHCEDRGVLAVANRPIGVDLERIRVVEDALRIAESYFSPGEIEGLRAFPDELRSQAFLRCWTRKEAFLKATGEGLSAPLTSFEVSLGEGESGVRLPEPGGPDWRAYDIGAGNGWVGALVTEWGSPTLTRQSLQTI